MSKSTLLILGLLLLFVLRLDWWKWESSVIVLGLPVELLVQLLICLGAVLLFYVLGGKNPGDSMGGSE